MIFEGTDYRNAYILAPEDINLKGLKSFDDIKFGDYRFYYSKIQDAVIYQHNDDLIILTGYCFDIRDSHLTEAQVLENLYETDDVPRELEYINGRYFVIIHKNGMTRVYSDASQLRPLVYHQDSRIIASHDELISSVLKNNGYQLHKRSEFNHNELDFTRFEEIFKFNPSLALDMDRFTFSRIYPRIALEEKSASETFKEMRKYLDNSIQWLKNNHQYKFLSLTGGIDSRVSAALTREISNDVEFMTYTKSREKLKTELSRLIYTTDDKVTRQLKENMVWNHTIFNLDEFTPSKKFTEYNQHILYSNHSFNLANYYKNERKFDHALHIKSTVFGLGKADFPAELDDSRDSYDFYQKCIHGLSVAFRKLYTVKDEAPKYFERNLVSEGVTLNRHYFDLFHLESRMGNWHSALTLETDPETDEFIFTNSRKMLDLIQQPALQEKRDFELFKIIIDHYWPILLHFGINKYHELGLEFMKDMRETVELKKNVAVNYNPNDLIQDETKGERYIQPFGDKVYAYKNYDLVFSCDDGKTKTVMLKTTYSNQSGRGRIKVTIRGHEIFEEHDVLDMNNGVSFDLGDSPIMINITYDKDYKNTSWQSAARIFYSIQ
ncbi:hypothetical protein [Salinicoccus albus]|uniref:hypothetical protein n=1 Tax=Salinicoccus albus TaxID=418756 RepID=UPI000381D216|nr:hypothetical protein [Salinicoccus albus]